MSKTKEKKKKDPINIILDLIIIVMIFVIIGVAVRLEFYKSIDAGPYSFTQEANMFSYLLENNDYASIIQGTYMNKINGKEDTKSYHALADYIEASSRYKVYVEKGYQDRAEEQKTIMDEAKSNMGKLDIFTQRIDKQFSVN